MSESMHAIYENGVFRPLQRVSFAEGEEVELTVVSSKPTDPAFTLAEIAEETGINDLAVNVDHYLYGLPKQVEATK